ncbi:hypothetical protein TNCV_1189481 [Trichonephila clavipes]|nr:hypothetical protein TNCV_1189481 [Trichonephila clavipes]
MKEPDLVVLISGQVTRTTSELVPQLLTTMPLQREDFELDKNNAPSTRFGFSTAKQRVIDSFFPRPHLPSAPVATERLKPVSVSPSE